VAKLESTTKQPFESYFVYGDFSAVMELAETIITGTSEVTATDNTGTADSSIIDPTSVYVDGFKYYVRIKDGEVAKSPYKITFRITTSTGNKWEVDGSIVVKES
jgi:hypothetical protein